MRICFWAGAGAGKSTITSGVFYELKKRGFNIELSHEYIKKWAYEKKVPKSFDQVYVFAKQLNSEDQLLSNGVFHLVTDSPLLLQVYYARKYGFPCWHQLVDIAKEFESKFPSINIFLDREGIAYQELGRYETESQAIQNDREMIDFMESFVPNYDVFKSIDLDGIVKHLEHKLIHSAIDQLVDRVNRHSEEKLDEMVELVRCS